MKIQSTPITFIDQTDSRKLEVYIKSNLPTMQIYNSNTGAFTPDWEKEEELKLEADVFLDSRKMEDDYNTTYFVKWYKEDTIIANNINTISVKENISSDTPIITYTFEVTYQGIVASSRIAFTRVDTGLDGDGKTGRGIEKITEYYLATASSSGVTTDTTGWTDTTQTIDAYKRYLWNYEVILYTDGTSDSTAPIIIGTYGRDGATGNGIESIEEWYLATNTSSGITVDTAGWKNTMQLLTASNKYLWNYELIVYTNGDKVKTTPVIIGAYGDKGDKGDQGIQGLQGPKGDQGIQGPVGKDGLPSYFHIKYSDDPSGNPMSDRPATYIGTYVDNQANDSDDYTKYTWSRFVGSQGAKGDQGIAGTNGIDGKTSYLHIAYATSADGKTGFSVSDSVSKTYIGQYTDYTEGDSTDPTKYKWTLIKGDKGDQGVQGPKGDKGEQLYTWIKYADTPTSGMSNDPTGKTYIGLAYNKTTATESNTYGDYTWSLIKGESGPAGPKGADGQQYYTWIKYADSDTGVNMSDSPTGKLYIGLAYNKTTSTESNTASDYTWALFKGEQGATGATGEDAVTFQVYSNNGYALSTSIPTILLQTFAYFGDVEITAGATFQWYRHNGTDWVAVSGATNSYFNVSRDDVAFSNNYMCKMQFNSTEYVGVVTIEDKNDENKVFASKPSNYFAGDLWIVGTDYTPSGYTVGTMLRAEHTNTAYTDSDWVPATKYDDEIEDLKATVDSYKQYFSVNSANGLQIGNSSINNDVLTIDRVEAKTVNADAANMESLNITGRYSGSTMLQAPVINLGKFSIVIESNGSLSIVANT